MTFYQTSCWAPSEGEREKRRDRWEFAIILTKTFHTIHCESTLRVTRRQLRSHKGGWLLYQAGKRSNVCLAVPHGGHSALSIGRLMHSKYHKSFNGGHSSHSLWISRTPGMKTLDWFEFFGPRVCTHGPAAESCNSHETHLSFLFSVHTLWHEHK